MNLTRCVVFAFYLVLLTACKPLVNASHLLPANGCLFIIGGGTRSPEMLQALLRGSGMGAKDTIAVLPMASKDPEVAFTSIRQQFIDQGIRLEQISMQMFLASAPMPPEKLDAVRHARIIYIPGGDQNRFMNIVRGTPLHMAITDAWHKGATIAGTSAGASVMSRRMITGNQRRYPDNIETYPTIEAENIELAEGLGLLEKTVVDQHFLKTMRLNRLVTIVLENPGVTGIGIDEATALRVCGTTGEIIGEGQVVVLRQGTTKPSRKGDLLGGAGLKMDVLLPGDRFNL